MHLFEKKIPETLGRDLFGLYFPHPVGLAPGLDPNGTRYNSFHNVSFVEVGPLMPVEYATSQERRFWKRFYAHEKKERTGLREAIDHIRQKPPKGLLAANIAPLPSSGDCDAVTRDMLKAFTFMYDFADLFIIDTFHRNAAGSCPLQSAEFLSETMDALIDMRFCYDSYKPILIRIDNDIQDGSLAGLLHYMMYSGLDGIIAGHERYPLGLIRRVGYFTGGRFPVVACGEIDTPDKADELLAAGASLLQVERRAARSILNHLIDPKTL